MILNKIKINDTATVTPGVVYDISKATGQSYETLSDALSGNNVLPEVREGGMSVRFVHTDDNKYVQYRLMANAFTTDITQWQGVDEEPAPNSNNLVKSGGIFSSKTVVNLTRILNLSLLVNLSNNEYGYNCSTGNITYKDGNGVVSIYEPQDGVLYTYQGLVFVKAETTGLKLTNKFVNVLNIENIPTPPAANGLYYSPILNQLVFTSETTETSPSVGIIRTTAAEETIIYNNKYAYIINNGKLELLYSQCNNILPPDGKVIDFAYNNTILIPSGTTILYNDNTTYTLPNDITLDISSFNVCKIIFNTSTYAITAKGFSYKLQANELILFEYVRKDSGFYVSLDDSQYGVNSGTLSKKELDKTLLTYNNKVYELHSGSYMTTGDNVGDTAEFNIVDNPLWYYVKIPVKQGEFYYVSALGGISPKAITITDLGGVISLVRNNLTESYFYIEEDGWLVVNSSDSLTGRSVIAYFQDSKKDDTIPLDVVLYQSVSASLSNGQFGYATNPGAMKILYKDDNGTLHQWLPVQMGDVKFAHKGGLFVTDTVNGGLMLLKPQDPIPGVNVNAILADRAGFYYSPLSNEIALVTDVSANSPNPGTIRTEADGLSLSFPGGLVLDVVNGTLVVRPGLPAMVDYENDDSLKDYDGEAEEMPCVGTTLFTKIYEKMDALVAAYPDFITKVDAFEYLETEMAELGVEDYPDYANGISEAGTYLVTPAYKTYMYIFKQGEERWGNNQANKHKRVILIGGTHGSEMVSEVNCYHFAKRLCEDYLTSKNFFALRNSCDFYILPILNGYGLYHGTRYNANGVDINRNFECADGFVESGSGTIYYTGSSAFSEFETKLMKCLTEKVLPDLCIDHHSYNRSIDPNASKFQVFFGQIANAKMSRMAYQVAVDFSRKMKEEYPADFGTNANILINAGGTLETINPDNSQMMSSWWSRMKGLLYSITCEVSHEIMYSNGVPISANPSWNVTDQIYSIDELYLRMTLIKMLKMHP